jgi:acyl transferase domain-containing protein
VAIVGMACVLPGAPDVEAFWANVVDGVDSVTEVPTSRWVHETHYDPGFDSSRRRPGDEPMSVSKWGGFVPDVGFDALAWGIPPASLASIDPAQLMALKAAANALEDAGYVSGDPGQADRAAPTGAPVRSFDRERASVVVATGSGGASDLPAGFLLRLLLRNHGVWADALPPELDAFLPELTEDGLPGVLTSVIAGRVANRLDLGGKNLTVDSACASVLVALDIACNELAGGSSDLVLCGAVDLHNGAQDYVSFTAAHALAPSGRCRSFDAEADGMTLAEGCGCVVLKRVADAERDGDRIYAVVRGVAGSSDGRHLGLTAPRQEGQERAVVRAYAAAGLSPREIGLVEAHGTGTSAGDRTELLSTTAVFGADEVAPGSIVLGSVKSNIGHTKCASAMASLIKAAKAAYHGVLPPTLHITRPNEVWDPQTSPFVFLDRARPWLAERRLVGVSSFGFGGTNFHAILENHGSAGTAGTAAGSGRPQWPAELAMVRAATADELVRRLDELADRLAADLTPPVPADRWRLRDIAAAVSAAGDGPVRLALVARDLADLAAQVGAARSSTVADPVRADDGEGPQVAFLLPGVDAVRPGMAADLLVAFPDLRTGLDGPPDVLWPAQAFGDDDRARHQAAIADLGPAALAVAVAATTAALARFGVTSAHVVDTGADDVAAEVRRLADDGVRVFVEVGPTAGLIDQVDEALADVPHVAVATDRPGGHGLVTLLRAVGELAVAGVEIDLAGPQAGRDVHPERWTDPPKAAGWIVNGHYARSASGASLPKGLHPASEAPQFHIAGGPAPAEPAAAATIGSGDGTGGSGLDATETAVVMEYLKIVQGMISTGSQIIRGHADATAPGPT